MEKIKKSINKKSNTKKITIYNKKLGTKIANSARPKKPGKYHIIVASNGRWMVVADGNVKATKVFNTKKMALEFAKTVTYKMKGEIIIHDKTGEIEERVSLAL